MSLVPVRRQLPMQLGESSAGDPKALLKGELSPTDSAKASQTKASELHSPAQKVFFLFFFFQSLNNPLDGVRASHTEQGAFLVFSCSPVQQK